MLRYCKVLRLSKSADTGDCSVYCRSVLRSNLAAVCLDRELWRPALPLALQWAVEEDCLPLALQWTLQIDSEGAIGSPLDSCGMRLFGCSESYQWTLVLWHLGVSRIWGIFSAARDLTCKWWKEIIHQLLHLKSKITSLLPCLKEWMN